MNLLRSVLVMAFSSSVAAGCGSADSSILEQDPAGSEQSTVDPSEFEQGVRGKLLTTVELSDSHRIDFFELTSGGTVVREEYSMDVPAEARLPELGKLEGTAAIFRALRPDEAVPAALLEADARDVVRREAEAANDLYTTATSGDEEVQEGPLLSTRAEECSGDVLGDGWGGQWFLDTFCPDGDAPYHWCWANHTSYVTGGFDVVHQFSWSQFEGDFNRSGSFQLEHRKCSLFSCYWDLDIWDSIPPRKVRTYRPSHSKVRISALSPCGHMGTVFKW